MSEDKARQGGDLGWKGRQDVVGAFAEAAFKLDVGPGAAWGRFACLLRHILSLDNGSRQAEHGC